MLSLNDIKEVANLISVIGKAGNKGVYGLEIEAPSTHKKIILKCCKAEGENYNYYDHVLKINYSDDKKLKIATTAMYEPRNCNYSFATEIKISHLRDGYEYSIVFYIPGWSYNDLASINEKDLTVPATYIYGNPEVNGKYVVELLSDLDNEPMSDIISSYIDEVATKRDEDEQAARKALETLSEDQVKVLKRMLKIK